MKKQNLNRLPIEIRDEYTPEELKAYERVARVVSDDERTAVYFDDLENALIRHIRHASVVVGCVAWLTNDRILDALASREHVSIVVQKEDFLRPDISKRANWTAHLRAKYAALPAPFTRSDFPGMISDLSVATSPEMEAVRCVGNYNSDREPAFPRAHHKFVVFMKLNIAPDKTFSLSPYAVWTGSFNFTDNAVYSFENAVLMTDSKIVSAYYQEFSYIYALSEPLNWENAWVEPEYRIGT